MATGFILAFTRVAKDKQTRFKKVCLGGTLTETEIEIDHVQLRN